MTEHNPSGPDAGPDDEAREGTGGAPGAEDDASPEAIENDPSANPPDQGLKDLKGG